MSPLRSASGADPQAATADRRRFGRWTCWFPLAFLAGLAAVPRLTAIQESLWLDELHTAWTVADGPGEIVWRAAIGNQSPLYFFCVWPVTSAGGLNEVTLRLWSLLAGLALVPATGWLVVRWTGSRTAGWWSAWLVALDANCIFYAQEARPFALVQLAAVVQAALFVRLLDSPRRGLRIGWILATLVLFYLHYTTSLLLAAQWIAYFTLQLGRGARPAYRPVQLLADTGWVVLGLLPAAAHLWEIAVRREAWAMFISRPEWERLVSFLPLSSYLGWPAVVLASAWTIHLVVSGLAPRTSQRGLGRDTAACGQQLFPPGGAAAAAPARVWVVVVCWLVVPLGLAWLSSRLDVARIFHVRYLIASAVAPCVLAGLAMALFPGGNARRIWQGLCMILVTWMVLGPGGMWGQWRHYGRFLPGRNQDWRAAVAMVREQAGDRGWPILVRSGLIEADALPQSDDPRLREYCLLPVTGSYRLDCDPDTLIPLPTVGAGRLDARQIARVREAGGAWCLAAGTPSSVDQVQSRLIASLEGGTTRVTVRQRRAFGNVGVIELVLSP